MPDVQPHLFVIFGATGDLAHRKLLPSLFSLIQRDELTEACYVFGVARSDRGDAWFREEVRKTLVEAKNGFSEDAICQWVENRVFYFGLGQDNKDYAGLKARIEEVEAEHGLPGNRALYLSIPPKAYEVTIEGLGEEGLNRSEGWTRLVVEKPFGRDLASAKALNALVHRYFDEEQVYRIDHYLGKETVQNLLAFRFANILFESVWNRDRVERIEITAAETLSVAGRAGFYDSAGALRDMIQNHLTQLFTLVAMEPPSGFNAEAIQREKIKVLDSVMPIDPQQDVIFGQYTGGEVDGKAVPGYRDEKGIGGASDTETFVALRLFVQNWRWDGVPFFLRTGKRMARTLTQIAVIFRCAPASLFQAADPTCSPNANALLITLKPDEGFDLRFEVKTPGDPFTLKTENFRFRYEEAFHEMPEAYETLLQDVVEGDRTLFVQARETEAAWDLYAPILKHRPEVQPYPAGSWGPEAAAHLLGAWTAGG